MQSMRAAIYDVDDTLLDNQPAHLQPYNMHEHSRFQAVQQVGRERDIAFMRDITHEENHQTFLHSSEHTMQGAVWYLLSQYDLVEGPVDHSHPIVKQVAEYKAELHKSLLAEYGAEVRGASAFVGKVAKTGAKQAIASGSLLSEIMVFLKKYELETFFPSGRVFGYGTFTHPKPHPDVFDKAFISLGLPDSQRRNVYAFEDDPKGVESAKRAGLYVCALTTRFPKETFESLAHAPDMIAADFEAYGRHFF